MPIELACRRCGKQYRVPDRFSGQTIPCKQCGNDIDVPGDDDDFSAPVRSGSRSRKRKSGKNAGMPWMIGGAAIGIVGLIGVIAAASMMMRTPAPAQPPTIPGTQVAGASTPATTSAPVGGVPATTPAAKAAPVATTPPPAPKSNAEYEKNLARQALERAYAAIKQKFSPPKSAIVIINGVEGVESEADHYLERKLFKAAYAEYEAGQQVAQQQTEANRKQAEQQAMADHERQWGGGVGPSMVWYRYKPVLSDVPFPEIKGGSNGNGQYVYYVGPATDLNQLGSRLGVGTVASVDQGSRTVTINAQLPVPIPDIDVEELTIQHGRESVVTIVVADAIGDPDRVNYFLETQVKELGGEDSRLVMVGPRQTKPNQIQFWVAPVRNINDIAARISFGSIADLDPQQQTITVAANIPADLPARPSPKELAEMERKRREGDLNPKDGEEEIDWAIRVLKKPDNEREVVRKVFTRLAAMDVDAERQDEVTAAMVKKMDADNFWWNHREMTPAINAWFDKRLAKQLNVLLMDNHSLSYADEILQVLSQHPSEDSAKGIASMMDNFHHSKTASQAMREMGTFAEDVLIKHVTHQDPKVRWEIYDILAEQGTKKSLGKLKANVTKEREAEMKQFLKDAIERLQSRLKDDDAKGEKSDEK